MKEFQRFVKGTVSLQMTRRDFLELLCHLIGGQTFERTFLVGKGRTRLEFLESREGFAGPAAVSGGRGRGGITSSHEDFGVRAGRLFLFGGLGFHLVATIVFDVHVIC